MAIIHASMHRCLYISLLMIAGVAAESRAQLSAVVYDMETRRCVPDVKVYINPRGTVVTDRYGRFVITGKCNSITLSHGSYEALSLARSSVRDTIWLLPKMRRLDEVVIYGKKPRPGFDIGEATRRAAAGTGIKGGSGTNFDFFSIFNPKARKHAKRRKKIKEMLDKY